MKLLDSDIQTREVLTWQGVHLIHFRYSSCSQKVRIFLNLKGIKWTSHALDLARQQNYDPWFLGINPRGLVPVLVHDGEVHIESNDILTYLDDVFPEPKLIPAENSNTMQVALKEEDDLHLDIRAITMRFLTPAKLAAKRSDKLSYYQTNQGTIQGGSDPHKSRELNFWNQFAESGIQDEQVIRSVANFYRELHSFDITLSSQSYLAGADLTLLDIAWFIYCHRLVQAGYPLRVQHPHVSRWYEGLLVRPEFHREVSQEFPMNIVSKGISIYQNATRTRLSDIVDFDQISSEVTSA